MNPGVHDVSIRVGAPDIDACRSGQPVRIDPCALGLGLVHDRAGHRRNRRPRAALFPARREIIHGG